MTTTLLAVDDSKTMRRVLEITFAGESEYRVVTANTVADAMAKVATEKPAIVLADAGIGSESGYDLCRQIKGASPGTVVLILSSKQAPYDNAKGSAAGADDHMDKPFDTQQMIDRVVGLARKGPVAVVAPAAPVHAPAAAAPTAAARPASVRSPTLSYGTPSPSPVAFAPPAAPVVAVHAPPAPRANTLSGTPAVAPAPTPVMRPAVAPAAPPTALVAAVAAAAPAAAIAAGNGDLVAKLGGLGLSQAQIDGVLAISREVIEQVVWEVVPVLAETMIQEEIRRLTR